MSLLTCDRNGRRYAQFPALARQAGLVHAFCTRPLDVSPKPSPCLLQRERNRTDFVRDWNLNPERLSYCLQVHTPHLVAIDASSPAGPVEETDGLLTATADRPLMVFSADCPLLLVYDPDKHVVGLVHSSWRCTLAGASCRLVQQLAVQFGCRPAAMFAGIGPSAGPDAYEVGPDVFEAAAGLANRDAFFRRKDDQLYFDLWESNRAQLVEAGVPRDHIEIAGICTMTRTDLYYSYRREGQGCGHFGLLAALQPRA